MDKIGFIGLGRMGRPMASNLRRKGFELVVHDVNAEAVVALVAGGAARGAPTRAPPAPRPAPRPARIRPTSPRAPT